MARESKRGRSGMVTPVDHPTMAQRPNLHMKPRPRSRGRGMRSPHQGANVRRARKRGPSSSR